MSKVSMMDAQYFVMPNAEAGLEQTRNPDGLR